MLVSLKKRVYYLLEPSEHVSFKYQIIDKTIILIIILNVIAVCLESVNDIYIPNQQFFFWFDQFSFIVFTIEYICRVWTCTEVPKYRHPVYGRLRYMVSTAALIDLCVIIPFFLPFVLDGDLRSLRILQLVRLLRIFKLGRYFKAFKTIRLVFLLKKEEIKIGLFIIFILLIISSGMMYVIEHHAQPEKFSSIPSTMWWSMSALTTIGYGDILPVTPLGKIFSSLISILGIGVFALPAGIFASGFTEIYRKQKQKQHCPHCGGTID